MEPPPNGSSNNQMKGEVFMYRFDFTEQYNFNNEIQIRKQFHCVGIEVEKIELEDGFYAALMKTEGRVTVWLGHSSSEEKVYAFTLWLAGCCPVSDVEVTETVRWKFRTNYANLKQAYTEKFKLS